MSDFSIANLLDLDDATGSYEGIEGRFARGALDSEHLGVSHFRFGPNFRSPIGHRHGEQEEVYVVVAGSGRVRVGEETRDVGQWDAIRVAPQAIRGFRAGPEGLELIIVGSDRPEEGDGEMVPDWWTED
jgi:mannose-6-phosphate isomerase-like protein (cupin superfamily)